MAGPLRIATRGSDLALWQARFVATELASRNVQTTLVIIKTEGDTVQNLPLSQVDGTGFFTKEVERALVAGEADVAVHSFKDLPTAVDITDSATELCIAAVPQRAPTADILLFRRQLHDPQMVTGLKAGSRVGTSSRRRLAQLLCLRPDLTIVDIRGNVPTRLGRIHDNNAAGGPGAVDAVILAEAGLGRLGLMPAKDDPKTTFHRFSSDEMVPAASQGALALQTRRQNEEVRAQLATLHHADTALAVNIERRLLSRFGGGCHLPLGVLAEREQAGGWRVLSTVAAPDGSEWMASRQVADDKPDAIASMIDAAHAELLEQGAARYLG